MAAREGNPPPIIDPRRFKTMSIQMLPKVKACMIQEKGLCSVGDLQCGVVLQCILEVLRFIDRRVAWQPER